MKHSAIFKTTPGTVVVFEYVERDEFRNAERLRKPQNRERVHYVMPAGNREHTLNRFGLTVILRVPQNSLRFSLCHFRYLRAERNNILIIPVQNECPARTDVPDELQKSALHAREVLVCIQVLCIYGRNDREKGRILMKCSAVFVRLKHEPCALSVPEISVW